MACVLVQVPRDAAGIVQLQYQIREYLPNHLHPESLALASICDSMEASRSDWINGEDTVGYSTFWEPRACTRREHSPAPSHLISTHMFVF